MTIFRRYYLIFWFVPLIIPLKKIPNISLGPVFSYFLHISSYFLHISSYSFLFIFFIFLHIPGTWKNSKLRPRPWDLEKFLHIELSSYIWAPGLRQNPNYEYLIYGHETCFYCRDLDGNLNSLGLPLRSKRLKRFK